METRRSVPYRKIGARLAIFGMITIALFIFVGSVAVQAEPPRMLTGGVYFYVSDWGGVEIWNNYNIKELDPTTGTAQGTVKVTVYDPSTDGWKSMVFVPECVKFFDNRVTIVFEVAKKTGVGNGEVGEHAKWQIYDSGSPGIGVDSMTIKNYQLDPWIEYWPVGVDAPTCTIFDPIPGWETPIFITEGNLTIH